MLGYNVMVWEEGMQSDSCPISCCLICLICSALSLLEGEKSISTVGCGQTEVREVQETELCYICCFRRGEDATWDRRLREVQGIEGRPP